MLRPKQYSTDLNVVIKSLERYIVTIGVICSFLQKHETN